MAHRGQTALVVHGHFYQPPRENPWTGEVEREPSAAPFHDWNERIFHECYRANAYARIIDDRGRVEHIVNNYIHLSFNFGPTLLSWLERHHSITYGRIIEADRISAEQRGGHGNALAQGYNHTILPLCSPRDRETQVRWGVVDFKHRFGRDPEGLWLPETAANHEVLDTLIDEGLRFTILSPYQALRTRRIGSETWEDASSGRIDPSRPYRYFHRDGSGRSLCIIFYDGPLSRSIAFEGALSSSQAFLNNLWRGQGPGPLITVATDGESYGHHGKWGDRTLAHALEILAQKNGTWVTNYAELLDHHPPNHEVEIWHGPDGFGSSWSCAHGVGRWFRDCGCHTGGRHGWNQAWRTPLRQALDFLRDRAAAIFEEQGARFLKDPWGARNDYIRVLLDEPREHFFKQHARRRLSEGERVQARTLLEMQHQAMLMYTSCGWFFSDISGIEPRQVLKYAGRVIDFLQELGDDDALDPFLERLSEARSNVDGVGTGADVYRSYVNPVRVSPRRLAAHLAISGLVERPAAEGDHAGYRYEFHDVRQRTHGTLELLTGRVKLRRLSTGRSYMQSVAAMHLGGVDFYCVVDSDLDEAAFGKAADALWSQFSTASLPALLRIAAQEIGQHEYGLQDLLPGGAQRVSETIMQGLLERFSSLYTYLYEDNRRTLDMLQSAGIPLPKELAAAAEFTLGRRFEAEILEQRESQDPQAYLRAIEIAQQAHDLGYRIDQRVASRTFDSMISHAVHIAVARPTQENIAASLRLLDIAERLHLDLSLDRAQEAVYAAAEHPDGLPKELFMELFPRLWLSPAILDRKKAKPSPQSVVA